MTTSRPYVTREAMFRLGSPHARYHPRHCSFVVTICGRRNRQETYVDNRASYRSAGRQRRTLIVGNAAQSEGKCFAERSADRGMVVFSGSRIRFAQAAPSVFDCFGRDPAVRDSLLV